MTRRAPRITCLWVVCLLAACAPWGAWSQAAPEEGEAPVIEETTPPPNTLATPGESGRQIGAARANAQEQPAEPPPEYWQAHQAEWEEDPAGGGNTAGTGGDESASGAAPYYESPLKYGARVLAILLGLCGVIVLFGYLAKRTGRKNPLLSGPHLGAVLGRVHLNSKVSLHYVRTGGKVLVLGVTPTGVSLLRDFDAEAFEAEPAPSSAPELAPTGTKEGEASFLSQLQSAALGGGSSASREDEELDLLRGDIQRLQYHLRESLRDGEDD